MENTCGRAGKSLIGCEVNSESLLLPVLSVDDQAVPGKEFPAKSSHRFTL